jgi:hypothetical protein
MVKCLEEGVVLQDNDLVLLGEDIKPVWMYGQIVLPVIATADEARSIAHWQTYTKSQIKEF